jgi:hypothetical protein
MSFSFAAMISSCRDITACDIARSARFRCFVEVMARRREAFFALSAVSLTSDMVTLLAPPELADKHHRPGGAGR